MGSIQETRRPVRIMNISGSPVDRRDAMLKAAKSKEPIDFLVGDWMSELNMPARAYSVATDGEKAIGYEPSFLEALEPALEALAKKRIKVAANAGCVATRALFDEVVSMVDRHGLSDSMRVAWVEGDVVTSTIQSIDPASLVSVCTGQRLSDWSFEPLFAQCYLGGWAIKTAFDEGADIVLCGRCADASPIVAAAAYWHQWERDSFDCLARALIAGHLIECKSYEICQRFRTDSVLRLNLRDWWQLHRL